MLMGQLTQSEFDRIKNLIESWSLPVAPPQDMTDEDFNLLMYRDKKVLDGELRLVLLRALGDAEVTSDYSVEILKTVLSSSFSE
jgi:3-dehydroquinate synthase